MTYVDAVAQYVKRAHNPKLTSATRGTLAADRVQPNFKNKKMQSNVGDKSVRLSRKKKKSD